MMIPAIPQPAPAEPDSLADVTERLFALFEPQLGLATIARIVRRARRELDLRRGSTSTRVEAVERLAHQWLTALAEVRSTHPARVVGAAPRSQERTPR